MNKLIRVKSFDATGLAPNGVLYAGDINAIQDAAAALTDFTQIISLSTVLFGDNSIQLFKYGASEVRLTSALRTDGIVRALGGLYAGAFTTTQRDAIASGFRPYGLVILNTTNNRLEINLGTDPSPNWQTFGASLTLGTLLGRGAAGTTNQNSFYFATDDNGGTLYYSNGTTWTKVAKGLTEAPVAHAASHAVGGSDPVTISKAQLAADVPVIPIGAVMDWPWASGSIPAWALLPYGQNVLQSAYPALQTLGDASARPYGGSAGVNLTLPDYRGRIGAGKDDMGGTAANRITVAISGVSGATLGAVLGAEGITLTTGQLPAHNHVITGTPGLSDPSHSHGTITDNNGSVFYIGNAGSENLSVTNDDSQGRSSNGAAFTRTVATNVSVNVGTLNTANSGSGSAHQNMQPSIIVNKIMRVL